MFPVRDITVPLSRSTTARQVLSLSLNRLANDFLQVCRSAAQIQELRSNAASLARVVAGAGGIRSGPVMSALRHPSAGALVRVLRVTQISEKQRWISLFSELAATLTLALTLAGALEKEVTIAPAPAAILAPLAGKILRAPPRTTAVTIGPGEVCFRASDPRPPISLAAISAADRSGAADPAASRASSATITERPEITHHPLRFGGCLALADNNPLSMFEAHPDKQGNAIDLGAQPIEAWIQALNDAHALVETHLPDLAAELPLFVQQIVPVGYDAEKHLSASYQEAIGTIYMTLHPQPMTMVEALIHEFSHNKINALFELDELLENAWTPLYTSPVRPDPRPLHGVLLAVHAFFPVARLYEMMLANGDPRASHPAFSARYARVRRLNREGCEALLAHARPTEIGKDVFEELARWEAHFARVDGIVPLRPDTA